MLRLLGLLFLLALIVLGVGWYLNWFSVSTSGGPGHLHIDVKVDKEKIREDEEALKQKVQGLEKKIEGKTP